MDNYQKFVENDIPKVTEYYKKSIIKTEQQKMLEKLLEKDKSFTLKNNISDIACGGGTLSYHLSKISRDSSFTLIDYLPEAVKVSKEVNKDNMDKFTINEGNIYNLDLKDNEFDFTFCWHILLSLDDPLDGLLELIRITKKSGKIYLGSLFNTQHDVDIHSRMYDYSRTGDASKDFVNYNTYSQLTIEKWLNNKVKNFKIHEFKTDVEFKYDGRGIGTFTKKCENDMIQISGGLLMNWGILEITV